MYLNRNSINRLEKIERINLMNSVTGVKSVLLIGTINRKNSTNLAIFSSIVHISSNPSLIGFFIRTNKKIRRDTFENLVENNNFTLNHIHTSCIKNSHYTSIKFHKDVSEFSTCGFTEQYIDGFSAPFVAESNVKLGLNLKEIVKFESNCSKLIIGEVEHIFLKDRFLENNHTVNLEKSDSISVGGLNTYYKSTKYKSLPYARLQGLSKL